MHGNIQEKSTLLCVARLVSASGLKGQLKAVRFSVNENIFIKGQNLTTTNQMPLVVDRCLAEKQNRMRISFIGIVQREQAEQLIGQDLFISRSALPELDEDEFYYEDLCGLDVIDHLTNQPLGTVKAVQNFGADDLLEINRINAKSAFISFDRAHVPDISLEKGYVKIIPPKSWQ